MAYKALYTAGEDIPGNKPGEAFKVQIMHGTNDKTGEDNGAVVDIRTFFNGTAQAGRGITIRNGESVDLLVKALKDAKIELVNTQARLKKEATTNGLSKLSKAKKLELFEALAEELGVSLAPDDEDVDDEEIEDEDLVIEAEVVEDDDEEDEDPEPIVPPKAATKARAPKAKATKVVEHDVDVFEAGEGGDAYQGGCDTCGWEGGIYKTFRTAELQAQKHKKNPEG